MVKIPKIPNSFRNKIRKLQSKLGQDKFFKNLIKIDPLVKDKINSKDIQRSIRAYEVKKFTKLSLYKWFEKTQILFEDSDFIKIFIDFPRQDLIVRIEKRTNKMLRNGAIEEVKNFLKKNIGKSKSSNKVIGINEISLYLSNKQNLVLTKDQIAIKTRQYAKRQTTWSRSRMVNWQKIHPKHLNTFIKKI